MLIDSHAHLDLTEFDHDRVELFTQMQTSGIQTALIPAISPQHWQKQIDVALEFNCPFSLGIHPWFATDKHVEIVSLEQKVEHYREHVQFVAIGECGLDKIKKNNWDAQITVFESQIILAKQYQLPLIIHSVKAHNDVQMLIRKHKFPFGGVIHGFYGSVEVAKQFIKLGFKLGVGGLLLNENPNKLVQCVTNLPWKNFILETDSPSMLPKGRSESRNTPLLLNEIVTQLANITEKSPVLILKQNQLSFEQLFDYKL